MILADLPQADAQTTCCTVPDNGSGTATLPALGCSYLGNYMHIVDGLPAGSTVEMETEILPTNLASDSPGGIFPGGRRKTWFAQLRWNLIGTGGLAGYMRTLAFPTDGISDTAPFAPFAPMQDLDEDLHSLMGSLFASGDPDFDLLRITAGRRDGFPSPGHTTLTRQPDGSWAIDSFFDIEYLIDFVGKSGGPFSGMSGSTTGTIRVSNCGGPVPNLSSTWGQVKAQYR